MATYKIDKVVLYHNQFKGRGVAWANNVMSVIPRSWNPLEGEARSKEWTLIWSPDEDEGLQRIDFYKARDLYDFIYLTYEVILNLEHTLEEEKRLQDYDPNEEDGSYSEKYPGLLEGLDPGYFDQQLEEALYTQEDNVYLVNFIKFQKQNKPAARYAKTEKGKLARKKWRQSPRAIEQAKERRDETKIRNKRFKAIEKWLNANPGKDFGDVPHSVGRE